MPVLPSGLKLALFIGHILEPDLNWFKAPEGHFWYTLPDVMEYPPPYSPEDKLLAKFVTAPVPRTVDEVKAFVRVCLYTSHGTIYWRGETLADFPRYGQLSDPDLVAWRQWASSEPVTQFLKSAIAKCETQAAVNKNARDYAKFQASERNDAGAPDGYVNVTKLVYNPLKDSH